jgi:hypothetical protein
MAMGLTRFESVVSFLVILIVRHGTCFSICCLFPHFHWLFPLTPVAPGLLAFSCSRRSCIHVHLSYCSDLIALWLFLLPVVHNGSEYTCGGLSSIGTWAFLHSHAALSHAYTSTYHIVQTLLHSGSSSCLLCIMDRNILVADFPALAPGLSCILMQPFLMHTCPLIILFRPYCTLALPLACCA